MTSDSRAFRHAVRQRMTRTGERYTTARRNQRTGRCPRGVCESTDRIRGTTSPTDSHALLCHHCRLPVCVACQTAPVKDHFGLCDGCGQEADRADLGTDFLDTDPADLVDAEPKGAARGGPAEVPMLHEVWDDALARGICPVCAAGLPHVGIDCPEDPTRRIDTPPPVLPDRRHKPHLPPLTGRPWSPWEGFTGR